MSRIDGLRWDSWPEPSDVLLLRSLLHADLNVAQAAWAEFRRTWDPDAPTSEQYRLFGLIADRLDRIAPDDDRIGMYRGVRRRTAVNTMLQLDRLERHLQRMGRLGVEPVVLKGAALVLTVYDSMGQRWFVDTDLLLHAAEWERVAASYGADGWTPEHDDFGGNHGVNLRQDDDSVDLHRLVHSEMVLPGRIEQTGELLETTIADRPLPSGRRIRTLAPTDALLHTLIHGTQRLLPHNLRWCVDADRLITRNDIDWWRLISLARTFRVSPLIHDALAFLGTVTGRPSEPWVLQQLAADRLSWLERKRLDAFHEWPAPGRLLGKSTTNLSWVLWRTRHLGPMGVARVLPLEFARSLGQDSVAGLLKVAAGRLRRIRWTS